MITNTDVARAVAAVQERGVVALRTRPTGRYINPARQNRKAVARELGCSPKAARKAIKRWRREAAEIARSPEALATMSDAGEARDRGML